MRESEKGPECLSDTMKNSFDLTDSPEDTLDYTWTRLFIAKGIKDSSESSGAQGPRAGVGNRTWERAQSMEKGWAKPDGNLHTEDAGQST